MNSAVYCRQCGRTIEKWGARPEDRDAYSSGFCGWGCKEVWDATKKMYMERAKRDIQAQS